MNKGVGWVVGGGADSSGAAVTAADGGGGCGCHGVGLCLLESGIVLTVTAVCLIQVGVWRQRWQRCSEHLLNALYGIVDRVEMVSEAVAMNEW